MKKSEVDQSFSMSWNGRGSLGQHLVCEMGFSQSKESKNLNRLLEVGRVIVCWAPTLNSRQTRESYLQTPQKARKKNGKMSIYSKKI